VPPITVHEFNLAVAVAPMFIVPAVCPTLLITTSSPTTGIAAPVAPVGLTVDQFAVALQVFVPPTRQYLVAILKRL